LVEVSAGRCASRMTRVQAVYRARLNGQAACHACHPPSGRRSNAPRRPHCPEGRWHGP